MSIVCRQRRLPKLLEALKSGGLYRHQHHLSLQAGRHRAARCGRSGGGAGRRGQYRRDCARRPHHGYNFDRRGWRHSFEETFGRDRAAGATVVLVGAGGAGRAVAFALMDLGVASLVLHDRDIARAKALTADLVKHYGASRCRVAQRSRT